MSLDQTPTPSDTTDAPAADMSADEYVAKSRERREQQAAEAEATQTDDTAQDAADDGVVDGGDAPDDAETSTDGANSEDSVDSEAEGADAPDEDAEADTDTEDDTAADAVEPPTYYTSEQREHFASLDATSQRHIAELARAGLSHVSRRESEARAQAMQAVQTKLEQFDQAIEVARKQGAERFLSDGELSRLLSSGEITSDQYLAHQGEREAHQATVTRMEAAMTEEQEAYIAENRKARAQILASRNPDLVKDGDRLFAFLQKRFDSTRIDLADADELEMAWKAMRYDESQKASKAIKRAPKAPTKVAKPTPSRTQPRKSTELAAAEKRFRETGEQDDYVRVRNLRRKARRQT